VSTVTVLLSVLIVVAAVLCAVGIWALIEGVKTARSVRTLSDDLDARVVPLLEKTDIAVDAINAELLRIDTIVTRFEEISDRVDETSRTVQGVANAPVEIVTDFADRMRRAWKSRKGTPEGYGPTAASEPSSDDEAHAEPAAVAQPSGDTPETDSKEY
jgi:hypothetical protein